MIATKRDSWEANKVRLNNNQPRGMRERADGKTYKGQTENQISSIVVV